MHHSCFFRWLALPALLLAATSATSAVVFTTWTNVDLTNDVATGSLGAVGITLEGTGATPGDLSFYQTNSAIFTSGAFSSPANGLDRLEFAVTPSPAQQFTLSFGSPVMDPLIHFSSVVSVITFTGGIGSITQLPGILGSDPNFSVSGLTVSAADNLNDADGTIQLNGLVSAVTFTTVLTGPFSVDGISLQVGADAAAVPLPAAAWFIAPAIGLLAPWMKRKARA